MSKIILVAAILTPSTTGTIGTSRTATDGADRIRSDQWHLTYLKTAKAHTISQGEGVTVAVPDTGIDPHPDLAGNLLPGIDITPDKGGDGRRDNDGHGTTVAGLIAAHGQGTTKGALGIAPKAKIIPIRVNLDSRHANVDDLASGIDYAIERGAQVISVSMAAEPSIKLQQAIESAVRANIVVVAGSGNHPQEATVAFPAAYPGVIAVGGIDRSGRIAPISVTGPEVDVVAPAEDIYSTSMGENYSRSNGTSDATAIVAGAAALVRAKYPYLPADEVAHRLTATAIDKGPPGRDDQYGYGVIDLVAALTADVPPRGFESVPATSPDVAGPTTAAADGPPAGVGGAATVRGLVTLGLLVAGGVAWALVVRHRRRSDDPPPRVSR
ncbi:type VII secretion-associated serine protease mycosin [Micromonospora maris]|uniref:Type VII secretion-associated serine protease mycosin n=1 Tax=Micromonospora maris TaxID=1003110 RepID=A0A9X0I9J8_9ACTN|nr:type VII secretion-associated serine protease mycosin [Micromonospora maris]